MAVSSPPISLDHFREIIQVIVGKPVRSIDNEKDFFLKFGAERSYEINVDSESWIRVSVNDYKLDIGENWQLTQHGKAVSKAISEPFKIISFKKNPHSSLSTLLCVTVKQVEVTPNLDLQISFSDGQELTVRGIQKSADGDYVNWRFSLPAMSYNLSPDGTVTTKATALALFPCRNSISE